MNFKKLKEYLDKEYVIFYNNINIIDIDLNHKTLETENGWDLCFKKININDFTIYEIEDYINYPSNIFEYINFFEKLINDVDNFIEKDKLFLVKYHNEFLLKEEKIYDIMSNIDDIYENKNDIDILYLKKVKENYEYNY